jgi:hypothetical protein
MRISHENGVFIYTRTGGTPTTLPSNAAGLFARDADAQLYGIDESGVVWQLTGSGMSDASSQYEVPAVLKLDDTSAPTAPTAACLIWSESADCYIEADNVVFGDAINHTITGAVSDCGILSGSTHTLNIGTNSVIVGGSSNSIAGSNWCFIGGGTGHDISGTCTHSVVGGGQNNDMTTACNWCVIGGGSTSSITDSTYATIGGGDTNQIDDTCDWSTIGGGRQNFIGVGGTSSLGATIAGGYISKLGALGTCSYSTIGGGREHQLDYATFATIAGGNTNDIIGLIANTADYSTVSGGRTNIINASIYSTIGGGFTNAIGTSCDYGFIGGGQSHDIIASSNATIGGGTTNQIDTSNSSVICGGSTNTIDTCTASGILGGFGNNITSADYSFAAGLDCNIASGADYAVATGNDANCVLHGQVAHSAGQFAAVGDAQTHTFLTRRTTTDATPVQMLLDGSSTAVTMPDNTLWMVEASVAALRDDGSQGAGYLISGCFRKDGAANPAVVGTINHHTTEEDVAGWDAVMSVSGANVRIVVTGEAAKNINWVATWRVTQVGVAS